MANNCRNCHFLVVQCRAVLGIGTGKETEDWRFAYNERTGKPQFAQRSWDAGERRSGFVKNARANRTHGGVFQGDLAVGKGISGEASIESAAPELLLDTVPNRA